MSLCCCFVLYVVCATSAQDTRHKLRNSHVQDDSSGELRRRKRKYLCGKAGPKCTVALLGSFIGPFCTSTTISPAACNTMFLFADQNLLAPNLTQCARYILNPGISCLHKDCAAVINELLAVFYYTSFSWRCVS